MSEQENNTQLPINPSENISEKNEAKENNLNNEAKESNLNNEAKENNLNNEAKENNLNNEAKESNLNNEAKESNLNNEAKIDEKKEEDFEKKKEDKSKEEKEDEEKQKYSITDNNEEEKEITDYWKTVLINANFFSMNEKDKTILNNLINVKYNPSTDSKDFTVEFIFKENEYFEPNILTKTYKMDTKGNLCAMDASKITWKSESLNPTIKIKTKKINKGKKVKKKTN